MLEYQEVDYSIANRSVSVTPQSGPFVKEPPLAPGRTIRGVLNFDGGSSNAIPFLWQRDARKLNLDLNRNRDLTDDGAAFSAPTTGPANYQTFTSVRLSFNFASGRCPVLADMVLYDQSPRPFCELMARSFWQGRVTLGGRDWQASIVQNGTTPSGSFGNGELLLRAWEKRNQPFSTYDGTLTTVPFSRSLFVGGHAYQLETSVQDRNGEARPALKFTEQSIPLGEVRITGKFIQRLVLPGGSYLVILDQPANTETIPVGNYTQPNVLLEQGGVKAYSNPGQLNTTARISVDSKVPAILNVGGPLTNSVIASRRGQDLELSYRLIGAGGATYQIVNRDSSKPPSFAIYKGEEKSPPTIFSLAEAAPVRAHGECLSPLAASSK